MIKLTRTEGRILDTAQEELQVTHGVLIDFHSHDCEWRENSDTIRYKQFNTRHTYKIYTQLNHRFKNHFFCLFNDQAFQDFAVISGGEKAIIHDTETM